MKIHSDQEPPKKGKERSASGAGRKSRSEETHRPPATRATEHQVKSDQSSGAAADVRFGERRRDTGPKGLRPDFQTLVRRVQRRDLDLTDVGFERPARATPRFQAQAAVYESSGAEPYAVLLTRVVGMAKLPTPPQQSLQRLPPLSRQFLAGLGKHRAAVLYFLFGEGADVRIYVGVRAHAPTTDAAAIHAAAAFDSLKTCLHATYGDIRLRDFDGESQYREVVDRIARMKASASLVGVPSPDLSGDVERCSADRLVEALSGTTYGYAVEAFPIEAEELNAAFKYTAETIAEAHSQVKWTTSGATTSVTQESCEQLDRFAQQYEELLEIAGQKIDMGLREGMWRAGITLLTEDSSDLERAGSLLQAVYAGPESKPEPIKTVTHRAPSSCIASLRTFRVPEAKLPNAEGDVLNTGPLRTALCSSDLGLFVELPRNEAPGYRIGRLRQFALDIDQPSGPRLVLGAVLNRSGTTNSSFGIDLDDLTRHALIVGVTGSGKTNTSMHLLNQLWRVHQVPFLVIEPAKAQYRNLLGSRHFKELQVFAPGYKDAAPFRINPFEFPAGMDPQSHISHLYTVFNAAFILYAPMPYILERSLYEVYEDAGWDLGIGQHSDQDSKTGDVPALAFPTVSDLYHKVKEVVDRLGYDDRIRMDVTAGLQARIDSLRVGHKGQTFECRRGVPFTALLDKPTVLELAHLGSDEEKAFLIGLLLMRLYETCEIAGESPRIKHVTLVEEAHRLLTRTSTDTSAAESASVKGKSVEAFCNILAEVRAYGEGLVIAEQIPTKLADDVLKNTNLKVMHRLVAADDRALMGATMNVDDDQTMVVTSLSRGEAVAFAEGVENPVLVQVPRFRGERRVSDAHVRRASAAFYKKHGEVLRQFPGCQHCADVCHFGPMAKRIADDDGIRNAVWTYALSCLRSPSSATRSWEAYRDRLVPKAILARLRPADHEPLAWCVGQAAAERCFFELRSRGISLVELGNLMGLFADMCQAVHAKADDAVVRVSQFRTRAKSLLKTPVGPLEGCQSCKTRCVFGPLGGKLAHIGDLRSGLSRAFKEKDADKAVVQYCERIAADNLFTGNSDTVRGLAACFYTHVASLVGARNVSGTVKRLFHT